MKRLPSIFTPRLLRKADEYLLLNHPVFWSSKLHFLVCVWAIVLTFSLLICGVQRIDYTHIPDPNGIFIYLIIIHGLILVFWYFSQSLFEIFFSFGKYTRFHSLRCAALFFLVFLSSVGLIAIPYLFLCFRINTALTDPQLLTWEKTSHSEKKTFHLPSHPSNPSLESDSVNRFDTSRLVEEAINVNQAQIVKNAATLDNPSKWNFFVAWGNPDPIYMSDEEGSLIDNSVNAYFTFTRTEVRTTAPYLGFEDTIKVYYNHILAIDSVVSQKFGKEIFYRQLFATHKNVFLPAYQDTSVERYYFWSEPVQKYVIALDGSIEDSLVAFAIQREMFREHLIRYWDARAEPSYYPLIQHYRKAASNNNDRLSLPIIYAYFSVLLVVFSLLIYSNVRFFGPKAFFAGLIIPCIAAGLIIGFNGVNDLLDKTYFWKVALILLSSFLLLYLSIRSRRFGMINLFQTISYVLMFLIGFFPIYMDDTPWAHYLVRQLPMFGDAPVIDLLITGVALLLFTTLFISKAFHLFAKPAGS